MGIVQGFVVVKWEFTYFSGSIRLCTGSRSALEAGAVTSLATRSSPCLRIYLVTYRENNNFLSANLLLFLNSARQLNVKTRWIVNMLIVKCQIDVPLRMSVFDQKNKQLNAFGVIFVNHFDPQRSGVHGWTGLVSEIKLLMCKNYLGVWNENCEIKWFRRISQATRNEAQLVDKMAFQTFLQQYMQIPVVTRIYTTACVITTLAVVGLLFQISYLCIGSAYLSVFLPAALRHRLAISTVL